MPTARRSRAISRPMEPVPTTSTVAPATVWVSRCRHVRGLQVVAAVDVLRDGEDRCQRELGDRPVEDALRVRDDDVGLRELVEHQGVDARRGDVDPLEVLGLLPDVAHRGREEVPEEQRPRAIKSVGEPGGFGVADVGA